MKSKDTRKKGFDKFKSILDFWATNSEEAGWNISSTDEGSQKMLEEESDKQVQIQMGSDVVDDFIIDEDKIRLQVQENKKKPRKQNRFQRKMQEMMEEAERQRKLQGKK